MRATLAVSARLEDDEREALPKLNAERVHGWPIHPETVTLRVQPVRTGSPATGLIAPGAPIEAVRLRYVVRGPRVLKSGGLGRANGSCEVDAETVPEAVRERLLDALAAEITETERELALARALLPAKQLAAARP